MRFGKKENNNNYQAQRERGERVDKKSQSGSHSLARLLIHSFNYTFTQSLTQPPRQAGSQIIRHSPTHSLAQAARDKKQQIRNKDAKKCYPETQTRENERNPLRAARARAIGVPRISEEGDDDAARARARSRPGVGWGTSSVL